MAKAAFEIAFDIEEDDNSKTIDYLKRSTTPIISSFINLFMISYNNQSKINKIKGNLCIIEATEDDFSSILS